MTIILIPKGGDLFASPCQTYINTTNTVGVMGKGIALAFKTRYPAMFQDYTKRCRAGLHVVGEPYLYCSTMHPWVINFPTKLHWKNPSQIEWIEQGLTYLDNQRHEWGLESLAVPMLGCSNGGLLSKDILPIMESHFSTWDILVEIYQS